MLMASPSLHINSTFFMLEIMFQVARIALKRTSFHILLFSLCISLAVLILASGYAVFIMYYTTLTGENHLVLL